MRIRHAEDGRRQVANLTDKGHALIAEITPESGAIYADLERDFGKEQTQALMQALRRLTSI